MPEPNPETPTDIALLQAVGEADEGASVTPEHVARALAAGSDRPWQSYLPAVRRSAIRLASAGAVVVTRKGRAVAPDAIRGVIRLRRPEAAPAEAAEG